MPSPRDSRTVWTDPRGVWIERHDYKEGVRFIVFEQLGDEVDVLDWASTRSAAIARAEQALPWA